MGKAMTKLGAGDKAPAVKLQTYDGAVVGLGDFRGKIVALYFYPKDNTSGCTIEAQEFRDLQSDFERAGAVIIGVSPDSVASHCKFRDKQSLNFLLLADTEHRTCEDYGVWVEKSMYGRKYWGVQRSTFLINGRGIIHRVWEQVKPAGHAIEVLEAAKSLV